MILTPLPQFKVVIDSNEQKPLPFPAAVPTVVSKLYPGDYSLVGYEREIAIERKSLDDLVGTLVGKSKNADGNFIRRLDKFAEELTVMGKTYRTKFVAVESPRSDLEAHKYRSSVPPSNILGMISDLEELTGVEFKFFEGRGQCSRWVAARLLQAWKIRNGLSSMKLKVREKRLRPRSLPMPPPPKRI